MVTIEPHFSFLSVALYEQNHMLMKAAGYDKPKVLCNAGAFLFFTYTYFVSEATANPVVL